MHHIEHLIQSKSHKVLKYGFGENIFTEGEPFQGVYYVVEGVVSILRKSHRKKIAVWLANRGDFVGLSSLFSESPTYTYTAISHHSSSCVIFIAKTNFRELLTEYPTFKQELVKIMCARIAYTEEYITHFKKESLKKRFLEMLIFFGKKEMTKNKPLRITLSLSDFTELIGSNKRHIKKLLEELEHQRLLTIENEAIIIQDLPRLEKMAITH